jgi:hypothetical protein
MRLVRSRPLSVVRAGAACSLDEIVRWHHGDDLVVPRFPVEARS